MNRLLLAGALLCAASCVAFAAEPTKLIFDTDMGNDVDDALALAVIHALESRGECELLAVTITKDHEECGPYVDAVNTFYNRPDIPIGQVRDGVTRGKSRFTGIAQQKNGEGFIYPHDLRIGDPVPDATTVLRSTLARQPDSSVVIVQVGFSTNLSRLLDTPGDEHSSLSGADLVTKKVKMLSIMAGAFDLIDGAVHREYNVVQDLAAAQDLANRWPTDIVWSGFEIGLAIRYPAASVLNDYEYVAHHPMPESYQAYEPTPHERPTWDLTSVLWAVRPNRDYFSLSPRGRVSIDDEGVTTFEARAGGRDRYLIADTTQVQVVREVLAILASEPPH